MTVRFPERQRDEVAWHIRVYEDLTRRRPAGDPNFFLWLHVDVRNLANAHAALENFDAWMKDLDEGLSAWLEGLDPDELEQWTDWRWERGGLAVRLSAIPKKPEARRRASILIGNPLPTLAWYEGEQWGTLTREDG